MVGKSENLILESTLSLTVESKQYTSYPESKSHVAKSCGQLSVRISTPCL